MFKKRVKPSLIGSLYKIIAKILANRLVGVLGDLVNEVQSAFVADRQILDGPFILDEVLQWCRRKKKHALIFKVDFEKAFDSVRWDFVDDVLNKFGFGERWRTWIQSCLRSSRGSILVNGSPTEEFQFFRGLKQGDPLSPFLFILIMESLHISFQRVVDAGLFTGIKINSMVNLSHLFYADDAIFLGQWSELNIDSLVRVLDCFFRASGLRINMCKSKIMGVNVEDGMVKIRGLLTLGCILGKEVVDKVFISVFLDGEDENSVQSAADITLLKSEFRIYAPIFILSIFKFPSSKYFNLLESIRILLRIEAGVGMGENTVVWFDNWSEVGGYGVIKGALRQIKALRYLGWINDYFGCEFFEECRGLVGIYSDSAKLKGGLEGVYMVYGGICGTFATSFCLIRRSLKRR
ncbi:RNA-directed DNA polymerase, eukaryota [Tanacetum coccineum]